MLAIVYALIQAKVNLASPLLVLGNVGEEGEGDLRGVRHFYRQQELAGRVAAHIVLDGSGADSAVTQALGSRAIGSRLPGRAATVLPMQELPTRLQLWPWLLRRSRRLQCPKRPQPH